MDDGSFDFNFTYETGDDDRVLGQVEVILKIAVPTFVVILLCLGLVGNICMMYAILRAKQMRTAPNILIFNLALGDLLYILIPTPIYIEHEINPLSDLSSTACKLKAYLGFVGQYASVFALAALSRERFTAIVRGMEVRRQGRDSCLSSSLCVFIVVWLAAILLPTPTLFFAKANTAKQCRSTSENTEVAIAYECFRGLIGYVIPLVTVGFYYVRIAVSLFKSTKKFQNDLQTNPAMARQVWARKRLAASVLVITIFFAVCWFPYFFYNIWILSASDALVYSPSRTADYLRYAGIVMPVVNTCLDPWLLFVISSKHRAGLIGCFKCWGQRTQCDVTRSIYRGVFYHIANKDGDVMQSQQSQSEACAAKVRLEA